MPDIDWSQFHPLMHRWASRECFGWYGGPWRHAQMWWAYQNPLPCWIVGHDEWGAPMTKEEFLNEGWEDNKDTTWKCIKCGAKRTGPGSGS